MTFGANLRALREERGLTQQQLAERLFVTRQTVSRWETGARWPDLAMAGRIARALEASLDQLAGDLDGDAAGMGKGGAGMPFANVKYLGFLICLTSMFGILIDLVWLLGIVGFLAGGVVTLIGILND